MLYDSSTEKLDCYARVITPENIAFEYALAGPFQRLPALLFDVIIRSVAFAAVVFALSMLMAFLGMGATLGSLLVFVIFVGYFLLSWFYGIYFETYYNGRTIGKIIMKLRVIGVDGRPINGVQAALRNLLRVADLNVMLSLQMFNETFPPLYILPTMFIGLVCMLSTRRLQRIGDLAAGTMVVSEKRKVNPLNQPPDDIRAFGLAELIPPSYEVGSSLAQAVGQYMETRKRLSPRRREEIAGRVAEPLIKKFEMLPDTSADLLMCALYVQIYLSDEQRVKGVQAMRSRIRGTMPIASHGTEGLQPKHSPSIGPVTEVAVTHDPTTHEGNPGQ